MSRAPLPAAEIISLTEAAADETYYNHENCKRRDHVRVIARRERHRHAPAFEPYDPEAAAEAARLVPRSDSPNVESSDTVECTGTDDEACDDGLQALIDLIESGEYEPTVWAPPPPPSREELAAVAEELYAAIPEGLRGWAEEHWMYPHSLPPTNLFRAANSFQRGVLVLVSIGARKVEGGWVIPGPGYEPDEGLRFVRDADVSRFACDLRMVKKAEEALGRPDTFTVAKEIEDWWVAQISGRPGCPHIVARC